MMTISIRINPIKLFSIILLLACSYVQAEAPQLMLATIWEKSNDPTEWWLSEKYDGVRGYWNGTQMLSRGGNLIALPDTLRTALPPFPLDGELWAGRGRFSTTLSIVRDQVPGPAWKQISYLVFDAPAQTGPFETRLGAVSQWLSHHPSSQIQLIEQIRGTSKKELEDLMDLIEARGGEGVMLRAANSPYQHGRSEHLRKYKRFDDAEAKVIGYNPGNGKYTGLVGSLKVELPDGTRFAVGSGLSDAERKTPPALGTTITFKHHGWSHLGKPRFPVFWRVREP
jgi:DNA ligase-1